MPQRARLLLVALFVPLALQAQSALPPKHPPQPTVAAITAGDLATRLYIFSDDSMQGREAGTAGNVKGTAYIAAELKRLGLVPGGDDGTYFQTIPLKTRTLDTTSTLAVAGTPLKAFTDYLALGPSPWSARRSPACTAASWATPPRDSPPGWRAANSWCSASRAAPLRAACCGR